MISLIICPRAYRPETPHPSKVPTNASPRERRGKEGGRERGRVGLDKLFLFFLPIIFIFSKNNNYTVRN